MGIVRDSGKFSGRPYIGADRAHRSVIFAIAQLFCLVSHPPRQILATPLRTGLPGLRKRDTRFVADMVWPISTLLMADMVFCVADMVVTDVVVSH